MSKLRSMYKFYLFFMLVFILFGGVACVRANRNKEDVDIDVDIFEVRFDHRYVLNQDILGFGWNVDPIYLVPPADNENQWEIFEALLDGAAPGWMRLVFYQFGWQPREGGPYLWERPGGHPNMEKLYRFLDYCQSRGIPVNVNNWHLADTWMSDTGETTGHPKDEDHFGRYIADFVYHLRVEKGYDVVQYVAIWNEAGGGTAESGAPYKSPSANYPDSHIPLYKALHEHLIRLGIRDEVQVIGIESFFDYRYSGAPKDSPNYFLGSDSNIVKKIIQQADDYIDIVSIHDYWSLFDYERTPGKTIEERLIRSLIHGVTNQIRAADTNGKLQPLVLGELGNHTYSFGEMNEAPSPEEGMNATLFIAEAALRAFNEGVKGVQRWAWNIHPGHQAVSVANTWSSVEPKDKTHPVAYNYYPLALFSRSIPRGSDVIGFTHSGGLDRNLVRRVFAGGFRWDDGFSIIIINDDYKERKVSIDVGKDMILNKYYVSEKKLDAFNYDGQVSENVIDDIVEARSITVYTTQKF